MKTMMTGIMQKRKKNNNGKLQAARDICGKGIAMGNAADEVKEKADLVIGSNDEDGIAVYLEGQNW